ncbi:MAG: DEAD/DEAH box helicase family protein [Anaerolineae bacterium]|nr:DEAD/DEAH box helicase family protein [Anaerolineae bacterium]
MRGELVAIDLETTGLDQEQDAIIEVGAVRVVNGQIIDEYSTLINPGRPIPENITFLTGIRDEDFLAKPHNPGEPASRPAPSIAEVLPAIRTFVGDAVVVGHNVSFDLSFLNRHGILQNNTSVDTYDLASVLMPRAPRYSLGALSTFLNIDLGEAHRALNDARASANLYLALWQKALALPQATLVEIVNASQDLDWSARLVFEAALNEITKLPNPETGPIAIFKAAPQEDRPISFDGIRQPINTEQLIDLMSENGALINKLEGYQPRSQQIKMTREIADAFNNNDHKMIEAGTGTGKSLAYLIPSISWAINNHERVVISTNTLNLQDQLIFNDIPKLQPVFDVPFKATVLKGRDNYLCPRRLESVRRRRPTHVDELRLLAKIFVWLLESDSGDKGEITVRGPAEHSAWSRLSAADEGCTMERCETAMEGRCPFHKARKVAENAHLLVVNHALLVSDALSDNSILPKYSRLIIDEAHHLEEAATNGLSFRIDEATLHRRLADLGNTRRGLLGELLNSARTLVPEKDLTRLTAFIKNISAAIAAMESHIQALFGGLRRFVDDMSKRLRAGEYATQIRITVDMRSDGSLGIVEQKWRELKEYFEVIGDAMSRLTEGMERIKTYNIPAYDDLLNSAGAAARYLNEVKSELHTILAEPADNVIYWVNTGQAGGYASLHRAPLHIGTMVDQALWQGKDTVIMTSATLRTDNNFNFIQHRLRADDFETIEVGSPFDYQTSTLLYIPNDIPDPNDRVAYQQAVERGLIELAAALNGRVLGLFTSYTQLRQTAQAITPRLALGNITVYDQIDGSNRNAMLDGFKANERAVLLGTRSFWEGVDIPGDSLSALVITRLPFSVPTDPIFAARSETYSNPFNDYNLPDAILRFRQGFGRLIRTQTDRGVVAVFDRRILSKSYGPNFLESLPDCTVQYGALQALPSAAQKWVERA